MNIEDFLAVKWEKGSFDRIIMNPPFANGADIRHIEHAARSLKPGGRLVSICSAGPRQIERLKPGATEWIDLADGTFKDSGTGVRTAIFVYDNPAWTFEAGKLERTS
jgi:SAM-dependent methyltransferase